MTKKSLFTKFTPLLAVSLLALTACAGPANQDGSDEPPIDSGPGMGVEEPSGDDMPIEGIDGTWLFADGSDAAGPLTLDDSATVTLTIMGSEIRGQSTCNGYSATLTGDPDDLSIDTVTSTKMACENTLMEFESRYFAALSGATTAIPTGGSLVVQGDGVTLNFLPSSSLPQG
ncbi:MAG: META domain-containing protein [Actinomycetales bacterium]